MQVTTTDGIVIKLTDDQIAQIRLQDAINTRAKPITERVKTLQDAYVELKMANNLYYPKHNGDIYSRTDDKIHKGVFCAFAVHSEKRAKSVLAYAQLSVIVEALNEGKSYLEHGTFQITCSMKKELTIGTVFTSMLNPSDLGFTSLETAQYCLTQFNQLWRDYYMLD